MTDKITPDRFREACEAVMSSERERERERERQGIGTLSEKTLHAVIKRCIEPDTAFHEISIGRFVADVFRGDGVFEIQTGSFTPLRPKLEAMLEYADVPSVTVVYPMAAVKYLTWIDPETGEAEKPRRSPKKMRPIDSCRELIRIKYLLDNPRFRVKLLLLEIHELRLKDGRRSRDGKRGSHREDRLPARLIDEIDLCTPADYDLFLPEVLSEEFTIKELAKKAGTSYETAQCAVTILCYLGRTEQTGTRGRTKLFKRT